MGDVFNVGGYIRNLADCGNIVGFHTITAASSKQIVGHYARTVWFSFQMDDIEFFLTDTVVSTLKKTCTVTFAVANRHL